MKKEKTFKTNLSPEDVGRAILQPNKFAAPKGTRRKKKKKKVRVK